MTCVLMVVWCVLRFDCRLIVFGRWSFCVVCCFCLWLAGVCSLCVDR